MGTEDNVTQLRPQQRAGVLEYNEDLLARMRGVEAFACKNLLRWNSGVLEQLWQSSSGAIQWRRVLDASELNLPFPEEPHT